MSSNLENIRSGLDELSAVCSNILDPESSEIEMQRIREYMHQLLAESEQYYRNLADKGKNSRSEVSRRIAMTLLNEERWSVNPLYFKEGFPADINDEDISLMDLDIEALYVEYLTGRARQALRDAEMGELYLKLLSYRRNSKAKEANSNNNLFTL